ncbi:MAG: DUF2333 family protein [Desulfobacteraceae bacterium]|nr:DUF2333 family protein [Desulfobacteraceae bacterium]
MSEEQPVSNNQKTKGFKAFFIKRLIVAVLLIGAVLWAVTAVVDHFESSGSLKGRLSDNSALPSQAQNTVAEAPAKQAPESAAAVQHPPEEGEQTPQGQKSSIESTKEMLTQLEHQTGAAPQPPASKERPPAAGAIEEVPRGAAEMQAPTRRSEPAAPTASHAPTSFDDRPVGVAFVEAVIRPMDYELNHRFWGWRPNDILNFTDNINEFQLGTLEVTRRTVVQLTERISRTGYNDAFDRNLENAMNFFMVKAESYWFPSPESKYKESLSELEKYKQKLITGKAYFYTRSDNLIPLFTAYEDLLGSCDENLVKTKEADGSPVGFTDADDYFYYAKGVANALIPILEAVQRDFGTTLEVRHGTELLHHAIESCRLAASLEPWIITNGDLDGILANHRANMAAPISHARYYMGQLVKTLST